MSRVVEAGGHHFKFRLRRDGGRRHGHGHRHGERCGYDRVPADAMRSGHVNPLWIRGAANSHGSTRHPAAHVTAPLAGTSRARRPAFRRLTTQQQPAQLAVRPADPASPLASAGDEHGDHRQSPRLLQAVSKLAATEVADAGGMAPTTRGDLRRRRGADDDTSTGSRVRGVSLDGGGRPVRHLVIFTAPLVGATRPAGGGHRGPA